MTKKLFLNFIRDASGGNLSKAFKDDIFENQKVVATTLSNLNKNEEFTINNKSESEIKNLNNSEDIFLRGWFDFKSLNLRYSNKITFKKYLPKKESERQLLELFNSTRSIHLGFKNFIGCKINIKNNLKHLDIFFDFKLSKKESFLFKSFLEYFETKKINIKKINDEVTEINRKDYEQLLKNINNQDKFLRYSLKLIRKICRSDNNSNEENLPQNDDLKKDDKESLEQKTLKKKIPFSQKKDALPEKSKESSGNQSEILKKSIKEYEVFTKEFDLFDNAENLATRDELLLLRKKFEKEYSENSRLINKLVKKLDRLLSSIRLNSWKFDQEEGYFDTSKFAQFIADPNHSNIFKYEQENKEKNTIVSLLLDNSGSMRGKPIITSAITTEIITKVLEKCNVNVEILGFTTREWKGGKSKQKWEAQGKKENPGRINDLLHIIYKGADRKWKQCKNNLGLILKDGLLKENIDGEALKWAYTRLIKRVEKKKILIVISDGAPVDDSTLSLNSPNILDNHLKETVNTIEQKNNIQLLAIGIGHDVSKYYKNAFVIEDAKNLGDVIIDNLALMLKLKK
jgi:cobaltochelatase CobT